MRVVIVGGTGTIGRRLVTHWLQQGHEVQIVSRQPQKPAGIPANVGFAQWDGQTTAGWGHWVETATAVVNLAGAGIADARWTDERKREIVQSRVKAGQAVVEAISAAKVKPQVLVQASAVGYYGVHPNNSVITEESPAGNDFLAQTCQQWEASTQPVEALGVRRVVIRTGVVLDEQGGALPKMMLPFRFLAGGPIGSGKQWFPWIHYADQVGAICFLINHEAAAGPVNLTAPKPLRNRDFAKTIGRVMGRPAVAPAPAFVFKLMFGEMATVLLDGQQAIPQRLQAWNYPFKFSTAEAALKDIIL